MVTRASPPASRAAAAKLQAFKPTSVVGKSSLAKDGTVKLNSRVRLRLQLEVKGGSYFRGVCPDFGQFGTVRRGGAGLRWRAACFVARQRWAPAVPRLAECGRQQCLARLSVGTSSSSPG